MSFRPLTLEDQPIFRALEKEFPLLASDLNFTNMYIWNDYYHFVWAKAFDCLCLMASPEGGEPFALPPLGGGDLAAAADWLFGQMKEPIMSRVPKEVAERLVTARPSWLKFSDPDNDDYVYLSEKIITLSGRRLHQKKNHYNHFIQNNNVEYMDVTASTAKELMEVEDRWLTARAERIGDQTHLIMERRAIHLLLENMATLDLQGLAIKVEGRIEAFTIGEALNNDTAVIHAEKGNPEIRGIYVALCSEFCKRRFSHLTYINREQDLGLPGLRFSKESLKPCHMSEKFVVKPF
ncbi:MAG: phosphatidylglycerol lysyltransferase domain-containing protein [Deltaproteobacteria bacterium]|jgi:hypothetical protein|nr:phosphatidylglycerol lysyltransferase domain-containing protein [Deltaproteobacteria bacterium]